MMSCLAIKVEVRSATMLLMSISLNLIVTLATHINRILVQAVDSTIEHHVDRVSDMLLKIAVSIEKQNFINSGEYDEYYEEYIEELAIENVHKRHGRL